MSRIVHTFLRSVSYLSAAIGTFDSECSLKVMGVLLAADAVVAAVCCY